MKRNSTPLFNFDDDTHSTPPLSTQPMATQQSSDPFFSFTNTSTQSNKPPSNNVFDEIASLGTQPKSNSSPNNSNTADPFSSFSTSSVPTSKPSNDFENLFGPSTTKASTPSPAPQRSPVNTPPTVEMSKDQEDELKKQLESTVHAQVDAWAGNKKNNLRSLLSALHQILWEDSGWQEAPLSELVQPGALKKYYRKAVVIVHPDKTTGKPIEIKLKAERLFELLSEAAKTAQW